MLYGTSIDTGIDTIDTFAEVSTYIDTKFFRYFNITIPHAATPAHTVTHTAHAIVFQE